MYLRGIKVLEIVLLIAVTNGELLSFKDCQDGYLITKIKPENKFGIMVEACVCQFPFIFHGKIQFDGLPMDTEEGEKMWCSCTENYDMHKTWGYLGECEKRLCPTKTLPYAESEGQHMTDPSSMCVFPFIYKGMQFIKPTSLDYKKGPNTWCATSKDYDADALWAEVKGESDCLPVDGKWSEWGEWGPCSASCDNGTKISTRTCIGPFDGGLPCNDDSTKQDECTLGTCTGTKYETCFWSEWGDSSSCSVSCGEGVVTRNRILAVNSGVGCAGDIVESTTCMLDECPTNCEYNTWTIFSSCSQTCGNGVQKRTRYLSIDSDVNCKNYQAEERTCNSGDCPVFLKCYEETAETQYFYGHERLVGENPTLQQCIEDCSARTGCTAVDYNFKIQTCYEFYSVDDTDYADNVAVNHYEKIINFADAGSGCT